MKQRRRLHSAPATSSTTDALDASSVGGATPLQTAWLPVRAGLDNARRELDTETFEVFVAMLTVVVTRWQAELVEREWLRAA